VAGIVPPNVFPIAKDVERWAAYCPELSNPWLDTHKMAARTVTDHRRESNIMHAELPKEDIRLSSSRFAWVPTVPSMVQRTFDVDNPYHLLLAILQGINNSSRAETIQKFGDRLLSCYSHKRECIGGSSFEIRKRSGVHRLGFPAESANRNRGGYGPTHVQSQSVIAILIFGIIDAS
jgi:hypothetical protein